MTLAKATCVQLQCFCCRCYRLRILHVQGNVLHISSICLLAYVLSNWQNFTGDYSADTHALRNIKSGMQHPSAKVHICNGIAKHSCKSVCHFADMLKQNDVTMTMMLKVLSLALMSSLASLFCSGAAGLT